jgi:predicted transcriptional regulator
VNHGKLTPKLLVRVIAAVEAGCEDSYAIARYVSAARSSVLPILTMLVRDGLICRDGVAVSTTRGRPVHRYRPVRNQHL